MSTLDLTPDQMRALLAQLAGEVKDLRATPTRTEFEAAAYRWLTEDHDDAHTRDKCREILVRAPSMSRSAMDTAIAAAMGWPTVPEVKS